MITKGVTLISRAILQLKSKERKLVVAGAWTTYTIAKLEAGVNYLDQLKTDLLFLDASQLEQLDTAGAWLLQRIIRKCRHRGIKLVLRGFKAGHIELLKLVAAKRLKRPEQPPRQSLLHRLGKVTVTMLGQILEYLSFIGETALVALSYVTRIWRLRWSSVAAIVQQTGADAMPIIALLSALVGVVLAYQMGLQLKEYGANIFIVDLLGLAVLREFAPLLTAIMVAGRSGSAFTAQIGTMKVNEELDAMTTLGFSPLSWLVLPRVLGLMIALPLLTVWADVFGVWGGMIMSNAQLGIGYYDFLQRFSHYVELSSFVIGICKAPVFALLIASVGCFQGFQVSGSAASVGFKTTTSVVQAIFLIIVADAIFSILFSVFGI